MTPTPEPPRDSVAALRELVQWLRARAQHATYDDDSGMRGPEESKGRYDAFSEVADHLADRLEALESGERVTLWRWKAGEDPGIDHARSIPGPQPSPWREMGHIIAAGNPRCEVATFARLPDTQGAEDAE